MRTMTLGVSLLVIASCQATSESDDNPYNFGGGDPSRPGGDSPPSCTIACDEGQLQCQGNAVVECQAVGSCTTWGVFQACSSSETCVGFECLPSTCQNGQTHTCPDIGVCRTGQRTCNNNTWSICDWQLGPSQESCDGLDNDCDGAIDNVTNGALCPKQSGVCVGSRQRCDSTTQTLRCDDAAYATHATRNGEVYQSNETACDSLDNDCDGDLDEVTQTDPRNCGYCGHVCPLDPAGNSSCADGDCGCGPNYHLCGGTCVSNTEVAHCGTRCTPCPTGANATPQCVSQDCTLACNDGYHLCGSTCRANDDATHCGALCTACTTAVANAVPACVANGCSYQCQEGFFAINGGCKQFTIGEPYPISTMSGAPQIKLPYLLTYYDTPGSGIFSYDNGTAWQGLEADYYYYDDFSDLFSPSLVVTNTPRIFALADNLTAEIRTWDSGDAIWTTTSYDRAGFWANHLSAATITQSSAATLGFAYYGCDYEICTIGVQTAGTSGLYPVHSTFDVSDDCPDGDAVFLSNGTAANSLAVTALCGASSAIRRWSSSGTSWTLTASIEPDPMGAYSAYIPGMAVAGARAEHVAYLNDNSSILEYARWDGTSWFEHHVETWSSSYSMSSVAIAVGSDDTVYILANETGTTNLHYAYGRDHDWVVTTITSPVELGFEPVAIDVTDAEIAIVLSGDYDIYVGRLR